MSYLYRHIRLDKNVPFYIGIGTKKNYSRAYEKVKRNRFWKSIVSKTDYEVEIILDDLTWEEACEKEKEFIALYGRKDLGTGTLCNLTDGGDLVLGVVRTAEHIEKLRAANLGKKMSLESIQKLKISLQGRSHSLETRQKMSKTRIGKSLELSHKENISKAHKGKKKSESHIESMTRSKLVASVLQIDQSGCVTEWDSIRQAASKTGVAKASIIACLKNKRKTAGGSEWFPGKKYCMK